MVVITEQGVTFEVAEVGEAVNLFTQICENASQGFVQPGNIVDNSEYLESLRRHYQAFFPLSSVLVCASTHTISGDKHHVHYEQRINIFGGTRGVDVYVIGKGLGTVFTLLGDGGFANWCFSGDIKRDGKTLEFL